MVTDAKAIIVNGIFVIMLACGGGGASQGGKEDMGKDLSVEEALDVPEVISDARDSASLEEALDAPEAIGDARDEASSGDEFQAPDTSFAEVMDAPEAVSDATDNAGDEAQAPDTVETGTYLCRPCIKNEDCASAGSPGELDCIAIGNTGKFCLPRCDNCPTGYTCSRGSLDHCLPESGQCECTDEFINGGYETICYVENDFGRCEGKTKCTENGLAPCSAETPGPEECNGLDDDCDGQTDEEACQACTTYYKDGDQDGYGVTGDSQCLSEPLAPYTATSAGDCDDSDARVHPGASAVCGIDADCDGSLLDPGEECDDGNSITTDGCANCTFVEFQVNTWTTNTQGVRSITSLSNGGFVVVWRSYEQDGSDEGVYGQRFDANGNKVGSEFQVNTWTTDWQENPSITSLSNGGFVVVWHSYGQDGSDDGVYGQRFDSSGNKVGSEFQVNTWTTDDQRSPSVTSLSNSGFVVVWESVGQDGSREGVYGQRFDSNGNKVGSEFQVNTWTTDIQFQPSITSLPNRGFVVVWDSYTQDGDDHGVYGQRFDSSGNKVGSEFQVNTWTTYGQGNPSITSLPNGGFVVVWHSYRQDGPSWGVYGQRFDSDGNKVGSEFRVNTWTTDRQWYPSITSLPNGGFAVVWESFGQDGSGYGVYGRIFSP